MKINEVLVSQFAQDDLEEITDYYFSLNKKYVEKIIGQFENEILSLKENSKSGRIVPELEKQGILKYRQLILDNYRIVYEISIDKVIVHTIIDSRRNFED